MSRQIKITKAGYVYKNGVKVSERKLSPFYHGENVLSKKEQEFARKWIDKNYKMVNA